MLNKFGCHLRNDYTFLYTLWRRNLYGFFLLIFNEYQVCIFWYVSLIYKAKAFSGYQWCQRFCKGEVLTADLLVTVLPLQTLSCLKVLTFMLSKVAFILTQGSWLILQPPGITFQAQWVLRKARKNFPSVYKERKFTHKVLQTLALEKKQ